MDFFGMTLFPQGVKKKHLLKNMMRTLYISYLQAHQIGFGWFEE